MHAVSASKTMNEKVKRWWICWYSCQLHCVIWESGTYTPEELRGHLGTFATAISSFSVNDLQGVRPRVTAAALERIKALSSDACNGNHGPLFSVCHQLLRHCPVRPDAKPWNRSKPFWYIWDATKDLQPEERQRVMKLIMDTAARIMRSSPYLDEREMVSRLMSTAMGVLASRPWIIAKIVPSEEERAAVGREGRTADAAADTEMFKDFMKLSREAPLPEPAYPAYKRRCYYYKSGAEGCDDGITCKECKARPALPYCATCVDIIR